MREKKPQDSPPDREASPSEAPPVLIVCHGCAIPTDPKIIVFAGAGLPYCPSCAHDVAS